MAAALSSVLLLAVAPAPATAVEPPDTAPTMVVLDGSGSMLGADPGGGTKIDAARQAVHALIDRVPDGAPVGLAVYGTGTGNSAAERDRGCQDVTVLRRPDAIDKAALTSMVDGLTPSGYTPIGRSLEVAAQALPATGPRSIVLVSDGVDTCAPPEACTVARSLSGQGIDLVVHTVGFGVDDEARAQLSCIAQSTGGTYTDAPDADALQRVLPRVTATALRSYEPVGLPIVGSAGWDGAPVASVGQYLDTIGQHETRFYAVDVPEGVTAYVSATVGFPRLRGIAETDDLNLLSLRTYGKAGEDCHRYESEQVTHSSDGSVLSVTTSWDGAAKPETGGAGDRCKGGGRYYFAVQWDRVSAGVPGRLPIELLIGLEPGVSERGPAPGEPVGFAVPAGGPRPVSGGGSFTVASTLSGTGRYSDVVARGELVFYRVRLSWGQGLAYRVGYAETPARGVDNLSPVATVLYAPDRSEVRRDFSTYTGSALVLPTSGAALATRPVRYANRDTSATTVRAQRFPGWYYIAVQVGAPRDDTRTAPAIPVVLDVSVTGTPETGPQYISSPAAQGGLFGEDRTPSERRRDASATPPVVGLGAEPGDGVPTVVWVAAALAGVVAVGALTALGLRRGRSRRG